MKFILQHIFENSMVSLVTFCCRLHRSACSHSNKSAENLEMCEIRVNTHILTGISRALIYLFSKRYARTGTLFSGVFRPFPYSYVLFLSTFKLNDV